MEALVQIENDTIRKFMLMENAVRPLNLRAFAYCHAVAWKMYLREGNMGERWQETLTHLGKRSEPKAGNNHAAISKLGDVSNIMRRSRQFTSAQRHLIYTTPTLCAAPEGAALGL